MDTPLVASTSSPPRSPNPSLQRRRGSAHVFQTRTEQQLASTFQVRAEVYWDRKSVRVWLVRLAWLTVAVLSIIYLLLEYDRHQDAVAHPVLEQTLEFEPELPFPTLFVCQYGQAVNVSACQYFAAAVGSFPAGISCPKPDFVVTKVMHMYKTNMRMYCTVYDFNSYPGMYVSHGTRSGRPNSVLFLAGDLGPQNITGEDGSHYYALGGMVGIAGKASNTSSDWVLNVGTNTADVRPSGAYRFGIDLSRHGDHRTDEYALTVDGFTLTNPLFVDYRDKAAPFQLVVRFSTHNVPYFRERVSYTLNSMLGVVGGGISLLIALHRILTQSLDLLALHLTTGANPLVNTLTTCLSWLCCCRCCRRGIDPLSPPSWRL